MVSDVPGAVLAKLSRTPDGHAALAGRLKSIRPLTNNDDIVRALREIYQSHPDWSRLWPAAEKWLISKGITIPN